MRAMAESSKPNVAPLLLRTSSLILILALFAFRQGELVNFGAFSLHLLLSCACGFFCARVSLFHHHRAGMNHRRQRMIGAAEVLLVTVVGILIPLGFRELLAAASYLSVMASAADSLILDIDNHLFAAWIPALLAALATFWAAKSDLYFRVESLGFGFLLVWAGHGSGDLSGLPLHQLFSLPIGLTLVAAVAAVLELLALATHSEKHSPLGKTGRTRRFLSNSAVATLAGLVIVISVLGPYEQQGAPVSGGLLTRRLRGFDFSDILRLESKISLSDNLILIVKKPRQDTTTLVRRFVISGYQDGKGFRRLQNYDEAAQAQFLPSDATEFPPPPYSGRTPLTQEYYLVNLESDAFVAIPDPVRVYPFKRWDESSFSVAYSVESLLPYEGEFAIHNNTTGVDTLDPSYRRECLTYGDDTRIADLAHQIVGNAESTKEKADAILSYLKYGDYRYSLSPGSDGKTDALERFLFDTKKGYCTYFAFSMTLMLRALDVPARIAVGFYLDPTIAALDYYPVRADMAHAWVEVYMEDRGWISYDPTTDLLAEGEAFRFSPETPPDGFEDLVREILDHRDDAIPPTGGDQGYRSQEEKRPFPLPLYGTLLTLCYAISVLLYRGRFALAIWRAQDPRRRATLTEERGTNLAVELGYRRRKDETPMNFARRVDSALNLGLEGLLDAANLARYGRVYGQEEWEACDQIYTELKRRWTTLIPGHRRIRLWLFPWYSGRRANPTVPLVPLIILCLFTASGSEAQSAKTVESADAMIEAAEQATEKERFDTAISLYQLGEKTYPQELRFPEGLADLYATRGLHSLAYDEYKKAETLSGGDPALLYKIATVAAQLNRDSEAVSYLERTMALSPDNEDAAGDLGWMYFKVHRLQDAERFLLDVMGKFGPHRGLEMTLGTVYAEMYRYEDAKKRYLASVAAADKEEDTLFSAVALYNLSILESRFYHYADAYRSAARSLARFDRSSGHLAKAELLTQRLKFDEAFQEFKTAVDRDASPLSALSRASALEMAGRFEEAIVGAEAPLRARDHSWMMNYGTDPTRYRRDIHEILADAYEDRADYLVHLVPGSLLTRARSALASLPDRYRAWWHRRLYRRYCRDAANLFASEGQDLDAALNRYEAYRYRPGRAMFYLSKAQDIEAALVPASRATYLYEEGRTRKDREALHRAIGAADPVWEKDLIAESWTELAHLEKPGSPERNEALDALYSLNPGILKREGFILPIRLSIQGIDPTDRARVVDADRLGIFVGRGGFSAQSSPISVGGQRYSLVLGFDADGLSYEMKDGKDLVPPRKGRIAIDYDKKDWIDMCAEKIVQSLHESN